MGFSGEANTLIQYYCDRNHYCADCEHRTASTLHFIWQATGLCKEGTQRAQNRKRVLFFQSRSVLSFCWQQMVEGKEGWLKNQFQHIYPLAVEQDTPSGPWGQPLRLICASIPHPHCSSLQFLFSTLLSLLPPLLWYFVIFCAATVRSSRASRENMLSCFQTCLSVQVEAAHTKTWQLLHFLSNKC